ncbi:hypothetical protein [Deinococcus multiflagellatus]|uniref:MFS transporter n=1 Tax=Deinococcus multiflagellatus TaxID=1656887 RepID=A0ABW1ZIL5_9DEIO
MTHPIALPTFRQLLTTRVLATLSVGFYNVPLLWWVLEHTGSGSAVAALGLVGALAAMVVAPWGGVLADRGQKKNLIQRTYLLDAGLLLAGAALLGTHTLPVWGLSSWWAPVTWWPICAPPRWRLCFPSAFPKPSTSRPTLP